MISKTANTTLMQEARQALSGKWGFAIGTFLLAVLLSGASSIIPVVGPLLIGGPLAIGMATFFLNIARNKQVKLEQLFKGFENFGTAVVTYLLTFLSVFLGMLCFIVPGIILALMLSQVFFILADNPTIKPMDALRKSRDMMEGNKRKLFELYLRYFFLTLVVCVFTFGIGIFWLIPYMQVSLANFHDDVNGSKELNTNALNSPVTLEGLSLFDPQIVPEQEWRNRKYE